MANGCEIAVVTSCDGSSPTLQRNLRSLRKLGVPVRVFCWDRVGRHSELVPPAPGITYEPLLKGLGFRNWKAVGANGLWWARVLFALLVGRWRLAFGHNFEGVAPVWLVSRVKRFPYVYHIHDNITLAHRFPRIIARILDACDGRFAADALAVIVPDESRILPCLEKYRDKILVLPNTFEKDIPPAAGVKPLLGRPLTVLTAGTLHQDRGIALLIEAVEGIDGVRVLLAGHITDPRLRTAIAECRAVDYRGVLPRSEALKLYREADVAFMFYEPAHELNLRAAPMKLGEALMMALPVVINSEVRISEKVAELWRVGYRCPYDRIELRRLLNHIRDDEAGRGAMAVRARKIFEEEYNWEAPERALLDAVRRACQ